MAWTSGTADNYIDLLDRFATFVTTNAALVAAGQEWEIMRHTWDGYVSTYTGRIAFGTSNGTTVLDAPPAELTSTTYIAGFIEGTLTVPTTGSYRIAVDGDDCIDVLIDGNLITGWYGSHSAAGSYSHNEVVNLTAGTHKFRVRFTQGSGGLGVSLGWQKPGDSAIDIIPASALSDMQLVWYAYTGAAPTTTGGMDGLFSDKHYIFKAPGLSGTEEIFTSILPFGNVTSDYYNWQIKAAVGYNPGAGVGAQPYQSGVKYIYLWNDPIPYWFVVNGNRAIVVAKVSNTYQVMYIGKFLPYFLPSQYPYPVIVAGTNHNAGARWSSQSYDYSSILSPGRYGAHIYYVDGTWKEVTNRYSQGGAAIWDDSSVCIWPTCNTGEDSLSYSLAWPDGGYTLLPLILDMVAPTNNILGEIDGIFWVSGHQNASENVITIDAQDYLVVQNVWMTGRQDYMAVRLA